ncbi:MAG: TIGR03936 family radical SAM-associated protein [Phycisphaerae bacterium]
MQETCDYSTVFIEYSVDKNLAYLSHQEVMRCWMRAFARAGVALRYSEGFNPHPRFSLPFPKSVGVSSEKDLAVVQLLTAAQDFKADEFIAMLNLQLPTGIRARDVIAYEGKKGCECRRVSYHIEVEGPAAVATADEIMGKVNAGELIVERKSFKTGKVSRVNLAELICKVEVVRGGLLWTVVTGQGGTVKIDEMLRLSGVGESAQTITRTNVEWE